LREIRALKSTLIEIYKATKLGKKLINRKEAHKAFEDLVFVFSSIALYLVVIRKPCISLYLGLTALLY